MSVRRRKRRDPKTGAWREVWMVDVKLQHPDGRIERVRKVSPVQTRRGAEAYERDLRAAMLAGTFGREEGAPTFEVFAREFMQTYAQTNNKPSELQSKSTILARHLLPVFGRRRLDAIKLRDIEAYKAKKLKAGVSPKTINNQLTVLRKILSVACEWEHIEHVPKVKWLRVPEAEFRFLDFEEAEALVEAAESGWREMILVALKTGLRMGELRALRWSDVDLKVGRLVVRRSVSRGVIGTPKSGRSREVPLSPMAADALSRYRHLKGELVFCNSRGELIEKGELKWPLWRACDRAGIERHGWHVLRHTFASHLAMRGAPMKTIQELLGHVDIRMTMRYAHLSPDARRDAVTLLDLDAPARGTIGAPDGLAKISPIKTGS